MTTYPVDVLTGMYDQRDGWYRYWIDTGFEALEAQLARDRRTGTFCHFDAPTLADVCLVPQVVSARRWDSDLTPYPTVRRIHGACLELEAFVRAMPDKQPDAA